jgi:hypothetical protein
MAARICLGPGMLASFTGYAVGGHPRATISLAKLMNATRSFKPRVYCHLGMNVSSPNATAELRCRRRVLVPQFDRVIPSPAAEPKRRRTHAQDTGSAWGVGRGLAVTLDAFDFMIFLPCQAASSVSKPPRGARFIAQPETLPHEMPRCSRPCSPTRGSGMRPGPGLSSQRLAAIYERRAQHSPRRVRVPGSMIIGACCSRTSELLI